ncbi:MAG: glycine cleavage system aminomethyltransferase GcvT [Anaerolineae bacterium]
MSKGDGQEYCDFFGRDLAEIDPEMDLIVGFEEERQARRLILIPSESICPKAVRRALGSVFTNIYAEGYPSLRMTRDEEQLLVDFSHQLAYYRRYADRRFYKGTEYADLVEALARRRAAECFATDSISADEIFVNIQPLSGAAANNSVYEAFVEPGDTVMGMALPHGGHLTHGSQFNRSGKRYNIVSYEVDRETEKLDYEAIMELALEHRPKMIIAGYTSYPWAPDWQKFREIADAVGAVLMADIAHPAGMVIAGVYPTPVGYADVITFTTHKTICGPRGAIIMTTDPENARRIDSAVFPGEQGGPHVNKFAAIAVAFKIAQTERFRRLQKQIVDNACHLAEALQSRGLKLAYGGTNTHLLLIDLNAIETRTGFPLKGEMAARILDLCGIVVNKNTIPGDLTAADASGIRLGTPWVTQRGMARKEMDELAGLIHRVLVNIEPFSYIGSRGELPRGKIDLEILEEVKRDVARLAEGTKAETASRGTGYPHYPVLREAPARATPLLAEHRKLGAELGQVGGWTMPLHYHSSEEELEAARTAAALFDQGDMGLLEISGERARLFLQEATTNNIAALAPGQGQRSLLLDKEGKVIDDVSILRLDPDRWGRDHYLMLTNPARTARVKAWLWGLSDGYIIFDEEDIFRKVQGPAVVEDLQQNSDRGSLGARMSLHGPRSLEVLRQIAPTFPTLTDFSSWRGELAGIEALVVRNGYADDDLEFDLLVGRDRAVELWNLLLKAGAKPAGVEARDALRAEAGLLSNQVDEAVDGLSLYRARPGSLFHLSKPYFIGQRHICDAVKPEAKKREFRYEGEAGLRRTPLYEEHLKLTRRMVPFAGWEMPVWYTGIVDEHKAVRERAGLFDVAHMGVLEVAGEHAASFLDVVSTNYVRGLRDGQCHYSYILDPDGVPMDDILVYRRAADRYMLVVNAVNAEKIKAWLDAVNSRQYVIDRDCPYKEIEGVATVRDLKDRSCGDDQRIDIALQGPQSLAIVKRLVEDARRLSQLPRFRFIETELLGAPVIISRTGYTGEEIGFEFYLHPEVAVELWNRLLEVGQDYGLKPAGLGARDSTRTEAGLPLYGHELAGKHKISPVAAGYGAFVKLHKPFFIGRKALMEKEARRKMKIVRFRLDTRGGRVIRPDDPVVAVRTGQYIGTVTSCTVVRGYQLGLAYVDQAHSAEGAPIGIFPLPRRKGAVSEKPKEELALGDRVLLYHRATILTRFRQPGEGEMKPERE